MKRTSIAALGLLFGLFLLSACYYDNPPEATPIDPEVVSFEGHILPILQRSCSTSNCHDGTYTPNLLPDVAWRELQSGGYLNLALPDRSTLFRVVEYIENPMPPGGPQLSDLDRMLILIWIQKGAPND